MAIKTASGQPLAVSSRNLWIYRIVLVGAALPLVYLVVGLFSDSLGPMAVRTILNVTGRTAVILLLLSLTWTPVNTIFKLGLERRLRRMLGLGSFAYAMLHFLTFVGLDYGFNIQFLLSDGIASMPFIVVGFLALLLMVPLAVTSTPWAFQRLGYRNWRRLHSLAYLIGVLVVVHFFWQAKAVERWEPLLTGLVLALLLIVRIPPILRRMETWVGRG